MSADVAQHCECCQYVDGRVIVLQINWPAPGVDGGRSDTYGPFPIYEDGRHLKWIQAFLTEWRAQNRDWWSATMSIVQPPVIAEARPA